jgi:hypothetical protein
LRELRERIRALRADVRVDVPRRGVRAAQQQARAQVRVCRYAAYARAP